MALTESSRARRIEESKTLAIAAKAKRMQAEGADVISLSTGEPDFGTPDQVAQAGIDAIRDGQTRYTAAAGTPALRAAGAKWLNTQFGLNYSAQEVMATAGAKPALHMALSVLVEPGDKVLLPTPYWVSYPDLVKMADGVPIDIEAVPEQGFVHTGEQIAAAAKEHGAKGIMLNYPNNPSGAVPSRNQMQSIVDAAVAHDLWIITDEIYGTMLYDGVEHVSPAILPGARERTIVVNGGSKSHSLTGWRIGFMAGPANIVKAAARIQSQVIGNPSSISQAAGQAACEAPLDDELQRRNTAFDERRRFIVDALNKIDGLSVKMPKGAFYALTDARKLCAKLGCDDIELASRLLEEALVATVPGTPFAIPGFLRISYAASLDTLRKACERIGAFAAEHSR